MLIIEWKPRYINLTCGFENTCVWARNLITKHKNENPIRLFVDSFFAFFIKKLVQSIATQTFVEIQNDNNRNDVDDVDGGEEMERVCCIMEMKQFQMEFNRLIEFIILYIWVERKSNEIKTKFEPEQGN